jgi:predicted ribosome quality control (RQC) complex YloA/Tae2 family protein
VHNNYYFLKQLSRQLNQELVGYTLVSCFSQNKGELVIEFNNTKQSFFIKASLLPQFCCLSFPESFNRARKNSVDLFNEILLTKVMGVRQFENERSFSLELSDSYHLLFKMHGNRSNIILFQGSSPISLFRNQLNADLKLSLSTIDRPLDFSWQQFEKKYPNLSTHYVTFGTLIWEYWEEQGFDQRTVREQWEALEKIRHELESPCYYIIQKDHRIIFSLLPVGNILQQFSRPTEGIHAFFLLYTSTQAYQTEKYALVKNLNEQIRSGRKYIDRNNQKLAELLADHHYQQWGDLIMANLQVIKQGQELITVTDFYTQTPVEIKLKKELSPQRNAEVYYRKSKNQQIEINQLKESIQLREAALAKLEAALFEIESANDLKSLRKSQTKLPAPSKKITNVPYHEFEFQGFRIWVGRNALLNDTLTLKYTHKDDLWLHAKDVAGSHVVIKQQAGKKFPKEVIERAAQLAAYNSKRKTETLCPVIVTPKKFVRKRKGDPPGMVVVERENVILVEPRL